MKRILLWVLRIFLTVVGISKNPMLLIFPMWIFTYLNREPLRRMVRGMPLSASFIGSGLCFGLLTEEVGQVFLRIFRVPVLGLLYALIVSFVYGIFPMLAYMVSEEKIRTTRRLNLLARFLLAAVALFVEWAVYGLIVLPA